MVSVCYKVGYVRRLRSMSGSSTKEKLTGAEQSFRWSSSQKGWLEMLPQLASLLVAP